MTTTPSRVRQSASGKSNGQWAVDGKAPLNANEEFKAADNGLNVRRRRALRSCDAAERIRVQINALQSVGITMGFSHGNGRRSR